MTKIYKFQDDISTDALKELEKYEYFYELVTYYAKSKKEQSKQLQTDINNALALVKDQITVLETKKKVQTTFLEEWLDMDIF